MHPLVQSKKLEIARLCRRRGVARLEIFGSAARDDFDPARSDLDFLVEFAGDAPGTALQSFFGLKENLETLFGRAVDLVEDGAIRNSYVLVTIDRDRQIVYAS